MPELSFPLLDLAAAAPFAAALLLALFPMRSSRPLAAAAAAISLLSSCAAWLQLNSQNAPRLADPLGGLLAIDPIAALALVLFSALALLTIASAPVRDSGPARLSAVLFILSGSLTVYAADNLILLFAGWALTSVPMLRASQTAAASWTLPRIAVSASTLCLAAAIALIVSHAATAGAANPLSLHILSGATSLYDLPAAFAALMLAVLLRKGVFPAQSWIPYSFQHGQLLETNLFSNAHLGAFLVVRVALPLMPHSASEALSPICDLALLTALYASVLALVENNPRRLIALLSLSQSCFILAGLQSGTQAGIAGSLIYWVVVAVSSTALVLVYRFLEVRHAEPLSLTVYNGLSAHAPRLAVFFIIPALALVGLPATLGFPAEDLLLHGALASHPQLGIILPLATALNAISFLRMFSRLFLGKHPHHTPAIPDALPRERLALAAAVVFLIAAGLYPAPVVNIFSKASHDAESVVLAKPAVTPQQSASR